MTPRSMVESKLGIFARTFLTGFSEALGSACGYKWTLSSFAEADAENTDDGMVYFTIAADGDISGTMVIEFQRQDAIIIASSMLQEEEGEYGEMESATLLELIQVAGERFRPERSARYKNVTFSVLEVAEDVEYANSFVGLIGSETGKKAAVLIHMDKQSAAMLAPAANENIEEAEEGEHVTVTADAAVRPEGINLELVMDVELNVTLRFGKRQLSLREVLELNTGSVLELDRQVDEPVELLLDGIVIARGEAVVIDGNYGLRVTEVAQPVSSSMLQGPTAKMRVA